MSGSSVSVLAPDGVPEVQAGDDLAALLLAVIDVADGDILCVTSKVVSKAEGRLRFGPREDSLAAEIVDVVARRGPTVIARTRLGATLAAAGIDASNVRAGAHLLLPQDPDATARYLREMVQQRTGACVAVVITDTAGRPWRQGQTDIALGVAGLHPLQSYAGRTDPHGNPLVVTAPAIADEIAGAAELAAGKLGGRPFAVVRGRSELVLDRDNHGPGVAALIRPPGEDLFGYGAREAVVRALIGDTAGFGSPAPADDLALALLRLWPPAEVREEVADQLTLILPADSTPDDPRLHLLCAVHAWVIVGSDRPDGARGAWRVRLRPSPVQP